MMRARSPFGTRSIRFGCFRNSQLVDVPRAVVGIVESRHRHGPVGLAVLPRLRQPGGSVEPDPHVGVRRRIVDALEMDQDRRAIACRSAASSLALGLDDALAVKQVARVGLDRRSSPPASPATALRTIAGTDVHLTG